MSGVKFCDEAGVRGDPGRRAARAALHTGYVPDDIRLLVIEITNEAESHTGTNHRETDWAINQFHDNLAGVWTASINYNRKVPLWNAIQLVDRAVRWLRTAIRARLARRRRCVQQLHGAARAARRVRLRPAAPSPFRPWKCNSSIYILVVIWED